ncbi:LacI family transcriptional regulator [Chitinophaga pendula]|uniref:LacI family DNA-binding transcriptional regulator n=1 Tax=Chitinophaga TaxID=79328 RepID=UPI000BB02CDB|nr:MULTISPECIES: LacI family DNA-binding transcriptional regulator [Chitinophaga]ASZ10975.1 LacI family transcriptional regulator [Chitinophaga sp. MD30]UCJ06035.1 LacI family transcriptional regulator [Chitinophaga pendula]
MKERTNKVTIYDIAQALDLSASTVSRALQNNPLINEDTREKVQQMATEMGYVPNWIASSLRKKRSNIIGLIVPRTSMYFQSTAISGIQHEAHKYGFSIVIGQSDETVAMEKELVHTFFSLRVDGLLAVSSMFTTNYEHFGPFIRNTIPLVFYDRVPVDFPGYTITGDDYRGGFLATEHLIQQGCKRIAHFSGILTCNLYQQRLAGYKAALAKYDIPYDEQLLYVHNLTTDAATTATQQLLQSSPLPDGLFAANDTSAVAFIQEARRNHIDVPGQIKVVGYANDLSSRIISPSLTTIEQSGYNMGQKAASTLIQLINHDETVKVTQHYVFPVELIQRDSTL